MTDPQTIASKLTKAVALLIDRADEQDKLSEQKFSMGQPWKAERYAARMLRDAAESIAALTSR